MSKKIDDLLRVAFRGDGAKWSVSDFYEDVKEAIIKALQSSEDFDTHAYSVKKEIQQGRVRRKGSRVTCTAFVNNDFDEPGEGESSFIIDPGEPEFETMNYIIDHLERALEVAEKNQKKNRTVKGFNIYKNGDHFGSYLADVSEYGHSTDDEGPPGDNYEHWGFQDEAEVDPDEEGLTLKSARRYQEDVEKQITSFTEAPEWMNGGEPEGTQRDEEGKAFIEFSDGRGNTWKVVSWD